MCVGALLFADIFYRWYPTIIRVSGWNRIGVLLLYPRVHVLRVGGGQEWHFFEARWLIRDLIHVAVPEFSFLRRSRTD